MDKWPISLSEAARRLEIPFNTASVLLRAYDIPSVPMVNYLAKGLDRAGFEMLAEKAEKFRGSRRSMTVGSS